MTFALPPDPWEVLQIPTDSMTDKDAIRRKYLKLVLKCHPDKVAEAQKEWAKKEFPRVQQAYEMLMDDAALAKYLETRRKQEQWSKATAAQAAAAPAPSPSANTANTSAARAPPREFTTYKPRTAEPKATTRTPKSGGATTGATTATSTIPGVSRTKVYTYTTAAHSRSQEDMPTSTRVYATFVVEEVDEVKGPRRAASYEEAAAYAETRRDDKRRREKAERLDKEYYVAAQTKKEKRERKEREGADVKDARDAARDLLRDDVSSRKLDKKVRDRERERAKEDRERERKREAEDKRRQNKSPYVEPYEDDKEDSAAAPKLEREKKARPGAGSKKHDDTRSERDRSTSRRNRSPAPPDAPRPDKTDEFMKFAASYMSGRGTNLLARNSASMQGGENAFAQPPEAPTPPNGFEEEESILQASARAAGRRSSRTSKSSREKISREFDVDAEPARTIPSLSKSTSSPPNLATGNSPPRITRASTMPSGEGVPLSSSYPRPMPIPTSFTRTATWNASDERVRTSAAQDYFEEESDEERPTITTRRSGRRGSTRGEQTVRYKINPANYKASRMDYAGVDTGASYGVPGSPPTGRRFLDPEMGTGYAGSPFASVKQSRHYGPYDVKYTDATNVSYTPMPRDPAYAYQVAS